jgi:hypothetical protein
LISLHNYFIMRDIIFFLSKNNHTIQNGRKTFQGRNKLLKNIIFQNSGGTRAPLEPLGSTPDCSSSSNTSNTHWNWQKFTMLIRNWHYKMLKLKWLLLIIDFILLLFFLLQTLNLKKKITTNFSTTVKNIIIW